MLEYPRSSTWSPFICYSEHDYVPIAMAALLRLTRLVRTTRYYYTCHAIMSPTLSSVDAALSSRTTWAYIPLLPLSEWNDAQLVKTITASNDFQTLDKFGPGDESVVVCRPCLVFYLSQD